jgi:hypothetical protein
MRDEHGMMGFSDFVRLTSSRQTDHEDLLTAADTPPRRVGYRTLLRVEKLALMEQPVKS